MAKKNYSGKLKKLLSSNDPTSVWKGLKAITSYKTPSPIEKQKPGLTPHTHSDRLTTQPSTPSPPPSTVSQPVLKICEDDVSKVFRRQKLRKAKGPDGVSPAWLKACAVQLSSIFTLIFNRSPELCEVPSCFKRSTIIPVPKKPKTTGRNDYRPVALTSMEIKSFERLVLAHLKDSTGPLLDPLQFAYRANRSVVDAVNMGLQSQQPGAEHAQNCRDDSGLQEKPPALPPLTITNSTVTAVESFRFLGTTISQDLKWDNHIDSIMKKSQQRLFFLRQLKKFNLPLAHMTQFYSAVIESVLCSSAQQIPCVFAHTWRIKLILNNFVNCNRC